MITLVSTAVLGAAAGLHGALYGAYKDSPHESFLTRRFLREIAIAVMVLALYPYVYLLTRAALHDQAAGAYHAARILGAGPTEAATIAAFHHQSRGPHAMPAKTSSGQCQRYQE